MLNLIALLEIVLCHLRLLGDPLPNLFASSIRQCPLPVIHCFSSINVKTFTSRYFHLICVSFVPSHLEGGSDRYPHPPNTVSMGIQVGKGPQYTWLVLKCDQSGNCLEKTILIKERCHSKYDTMKITPCAKAISAEQRLHFLQLFTSSGSPIWVKYPWTEW